MENLTEVKKFLKDCIYKLGMGFHADTDFNDYVIQDGYTTPGTKTFPTEQAEQLNAKMEKAFKICEKEGEEIYQLSIAILTDFRIHEVIQKAVSDISNVFKSSLDEAMDGDESQRYANLFLLELDYSQGNIDRRSEYEPALETDDYLIPQDNTAE